MRPPQLAGLQRRRLASRLIEFGRWIIEPEFLPTPEERFPTQQKMIASLQWLRSSDRLPHTGAPVRSKRGFLGWLLDHDELPAAPAVSPVPHQALVRWIVSGEALDRSNDVTPTKEVPPHGP